MARTALVAGVGPGLGESLARKFAREGCRVGLFARSGDYIAELAADLPAEAAAVKTDLRDPDAIRAGFETVRDELGPVDVLVNHASAGAWEGIRDCSVETFERAWEVNGRGAFVCSKEAVEDMLGTDEGTGDGTDDESGGTIIFTGATSAVRGRGGAVAFSAAKFAARGMAQDVAQDLAGEGIHVAHVVLDGGILTPAARERDPDLDEDEFLDPDAIAETYWHVVEQDSTATMPFEVHVTNGPGDIEFL